MRVAAAVSPLWHDIGVHMVASLRQAYIDRQLKPPSTTATVPVTNLAASDIR